MIVTKDGKQWDPAKERLVGSVKTVRSRDIHRPAVIGEYPVFVEQFGGYRMFTWNFKLETV